MKHALKRALHLWPLCLVLLLAACGNATAQTPQAAIENYLRTRMAGDEATLLPLVCNAREAAARTEALSFKAMQASIETLSCSAGATEGEFTLVACTGVMITSYQGETRSRDLSARQYKALLEDGRWKACGEQ
jgi:hypothetical protein